MVNMRLFGAKKPTEKEKREEAKRLKTDILLLNRKIEMGQQICGERCDLPSRQLKDLQQEILRRSDRLTQLEPKKPACETAI